MSETIDILSMSQEQFLEMELADWMECVEELQKMGIVSMQKMQAHLDSIQTVEDIRYLYFKKCNVGQMVLLESDNEAIEQLMARLYAFMEGTLQYYLCIFKDEAFGGEMEMLPKDAKAAVWLNSMFAREEADVEGRRADLEECAKAYPALKNNLDCLINYRC